MPSIGAVGIKAELARWDATADVPATSNISLTSNRVLNYYSIENTACELEATEHDDTTWTSMENVASETISDTLADIPVAHNPIPTSGSVRWRNPTAGALYIKAVGWRLV